MSISYSAISIFFCIPESIAKPAIKTIVIIEDIVDTGITMDAIKKQLSGYEPKEIKIATLIFKPDSFQGDYQIDYKGFSIPNDFIVGYGLDYDGYGRNLSSIYKIKAD